MLVRGSGLALLRATNRLCCLELGRGGRRALVSIYNPSRFNKDATCLSKSEELLTRLSLFDTYLQRPPSSTFYLHSSQTT
jgi:hypothetical protein